ncbi:MAG: hypothetical protein WCK78_11060 [Paludibacter sp.]
MKKDKLILLILFVFLFTVFYGLLKVIPADFNDMHDHAAFARDMCTGKIPYTGNFLVYLLVNIFSFFSAGIKATELSLCGLLAFAGTYRYYLSYQKIKTVIATPSTHQLFAIMASLAMLIIFVIPIPGYFTDDRYMYIGSFTPNVWHNSTILFLFPFAMLLFEQSWKQLNTFDPKRNGWILLLIALNLFIKPSFFFVFICVYPMMLLYKYRFRKEFWLGILPVFLGGVLLIGQYIVIYKINTQVVNDTSSVVFMPFWKNPELKEDMINLPISMIFSLLFPLTYTVLNFRKLIHNQLFWYTFLSFVVSVLIFFFISESGPRASHGNFYWQIVITTWLCFFTTLLGLLKDFKTVGKSVKNTVLFTLFVIHTLLGMVYLAKILLTGSYY